MSRQHNKRSSKLQPISDVEIERKLLHMVRFIEQEGYERAEEINARTEEEFNIEKGNLVQKARIQINKDYEKRCSNFSKQELIKTALISQHFRRDLLAARVGHIANVQDTVKERIDQDLSCSKRRFNVLELLILEGLFKLIEPEVLIRCRMIDVPIIKNDIHQIITKYQDKVFEDIKLDVDTSAYLPATILPGVILFARRGKIALNNTLESRIAQTIRNCTPVMSTIFFGTSKFNKAKEFRKNKLNFS